MINRSARLVFGLSGLLAICSMASAAGLRSDYVACDSEESFSAYTDAIAAGDKAGAAALRSSSCVSTSAVASWQVVVLKRGFSVTKIRVTNKKDSVVLWTFREAVIDN